MDEKMGCDICGEIPLEYELDSQHIRNSLVKRGIRKWLLCDECIVIVDSFVNNLQALRPNKEVKNWPTMQSIDHAGQATATERKSRIDKKPDEFARKANFKELGNKIHGLRADIDAISKTMHKQYYDLVQEIGDLTRMLNDRK